MAFLSLALVTITFSLIFALIQVQWSRRNLYKLAKKIPGPPGYPIVGSALSYLSQSGENLLDSIGNSLDYYGSLSKVWLGSVLFVNVSSPQKIKIILNSNCCIEKPYVYKFLGVNLGLMVAPSK